jgi:hypothetical protein
MTLSGEIPRNADLSKLRGNLESEWRRAPKSKPIGGQGPAQYAMSFCNAAHRKMLSTDRNIFALWVEPD